MVGNRRPPLFLSHLPNNRDVSPSARQPEAEPIRRPRWLILTGVLILLGFMWFLLMELWPLSQVAPLIDAQNRIVVYHGVNVSNHAKSARDFVPEWSYDDYKKLHDHGFNMVRYLVFWEGIEPERGRVNHEYLTKTLTRIDWLAEIGFDVVIDLHQDLFARRFKGNGFPDWIVNDGGAPFHPQVPWFRNYLEPAVQNAFSHFWQSKEDQAAYIQIVRLLLESLDDRPNVIGLDIMNEPWPDRLFGFEAGPLTDFYSAVASMHQERGFRIPLYFSPMLPTNAGFNSSLRMAPTAGSIYAFHYYDPAVDMGGSYGLLNKFWMRRTIRQRVREAARMNIPAIAGEFGIQTNTPGFSHHLKDFMNVTEDYGIGWAYWSYDKGSFGFLKNDGSPGPAMEILTKPYAQRIAGREPKIRRGENFFEISYQPLTTKAPTLVFIPSDLKNVSINGEPQLSDHGPIFKYWNQKSGETERVRVQWD